MSDASLIDEERSRLQAWLAGFTAAALLVLAAIALIGLDIPAAALQAAPSAYYAIFAGATVMVAVLLAAEFLRTGDVAAGMTALAYWMLGCVTADQHWRAVLVPPNETHWAAFLGMQTGFDLAKALLFCVAVAGAALTAHRPALAIPARGRLGASAAAALAGGLLALLADRLLDLDGALDRADMLGPFPASSASLVLWVVSGLALLALVGLSGLKRASELWIAVAILGQLLAVMIGLKLAAPRSLAWYGAVVCAATPVLALLAVLLHGLVSRHDRALRSFDRLEQLARIDGLTGLTNRRYFDTRLEREWRRTRREAGSISLLMIDIDGFRAFKERYGHAGGDDCLRRVAACIATTVERPGDVAARYGGDEFAIILPTTDIAGARKIAARICGGVRRLGIPAAPSAGVVTVSVGIASLRPTADTPMVELIETADRALYRAKAAGRDRVAEDLAELTVRLAASSG